MGREGAHGAVGNMARRVGEMRAVSEKPKRQRKKCKLGGGPRQLRQTKNGLYWPGKKRNEQKRDGKGRTSSGIEYENNEQGKRRGAERLDAKKEEHSLFAGG